jgi:hypothetical protein
MKRQFFALTAIAVFLAAMFIIPPSSGAQTITVQSKKEGVRKGTPTARTATWTGNGAYYDEGDFTLSESRCEESEGEPYLYWVLTAGGRDSIGSAAITIDGSGPYTMSRQRNGSFKYTQTFENNTPDSNSVTSFVVPTTVTATFTKAKSANLVISHGCTGETVERPSFSLSFEEGTDGLYSFIGTDCVEDGKGENFGFFSEYEGQTFEVCATPANGYNVGFLLIPGSTVTSSPEANCSPLSGDGFNLGGLEGPAGDDSEIWFCLVTDADTVITISAGDSPPPPPPPPACTADPTSGVEYETILQGVNGSVAGVAFTNQTVTIRAVGDIANVFQAFEYGFNYHKINLASVTLSISGTSISTGASVDGGMQIFTSDRGDGTAGFIWQEPVPAEFLTYPGADLFPMSIGEIGTTYPVQADRLVKCWSASLTTGFGATHTGFIQNQWNTIPMTVNNGTSVIFTNHSVSLNGTTAVRPFDNTLVINRFER